MIRRSALFAVACALAATGSLAKADLVTNGSFESPVIPSGSYAIFGSIPGWTTSSGPGIEIQNHIAGSPYHLDQFVELDSDSNSSMYQDLVTVAGQTYTLSFAYSPRPGVSDESNGIDLLWDGSLVTNIALNGIGNGDTVWTVYSFNLVATSSLTRLEFAATGTSESLGGYLDAVSVNKVVPEPSSFVLAGIAGLAGLGFARKRKLSA
jgi:hypothetical protein